MFPLIHVYQFGEVNIEYWEYALSFVYLVILWLLMARRKNRLIAKAPEYGYYLWGMLAKVMGGLFFSLIYFYYYQGGDTIAYYYSAVAMRNLFLVDPIAYLDQLFGPIALERLSVYTSETGFPLRYIYADHRSFFVVRLMSPVAILTFGSYLVSTLLVACLSYLGIWACFRTFVSYFPQLTGKLAICFLFIPSLLFWGSGILKDTFTLSAVCWWVHCIDEIFFKKRSGFKKWSFLIISGLLIIELKPYIFMVLFPVTMLWLFYFRVVRLRNIMIKFVVLPFAVIMLAGASLFVLTNLSAQLDKFALDEALHTIQITQKDLLKEEAYGRNSFNIGEIDGTWQSVLSKFPVAVNAALFRPYMWEARSAIVALSGLENLWVMAVALFAIFRAGPFFFLRAVAGNPLLLMCVTFSVLFAFIIGVTTPNFGALVRFKIPLIPFFLSSLYVVGYLAVLERRYRKENKRFDLEEFRMGTAHLGPTPKRNVKRARPMMRKPSFSA